MLLRIDLGINVIFYKRFLFLLSLLLLYLLFKQKSYDKNNKKEKE